MASNCVVLHWISSAVIFTVLVTFGHCEEVSWSIDALNAEQGDTITISCTVTDLVPFDVVRTELKKGNERYTISDNDFLKPMFSNTGRYELAMYEDGGDSITNITYKGIRGEDSGTLECFSLAKPDDRATATVDVKVPLKSVYIQVIRDDMPHDINNGDTYRMIEGTETGVICGAIIDGSVAPPTMRIRRDSEDVTKDFIKEEIPVIVNAGDSLPKESITVKYSYITAHPDRNYNQKQLACSVETADGNSQQAYIFLEVYYIPILSCKTTEYFGQIGKTISIVCDIRSNPGAKYTIYYSDQDGELTTEEHPGHAQFRVESKIISEGHTKLHINIHKVEESHFGRYFIRASNDYGQGQTEFYLRRGATEVDIEPPMELTPPSVAQKPVRPSTKRPKSSVHKELIKNSRAKPKELASKSNSAISSMIVDKSVNLLITLGLFITSLIYISRL